MSGVVRLGGLSRQQEEFALAVASGMTQTDAYVQAYKSSVTDRQQLCVKASQVASKQRVKDRIEELRKPIIEKMGITLENHLKTLEELRNEARAEKKYAAAISAEVSRGKASGLYVERVHTTSDQNPQFVVIMPDENLSDDSTS